MIMVVEEGFSLSFITVVNLSQSKSEKGEPIRAEDGVITRRGGPHVNLLPEGAALTELTKNPNPETGVRVNPHKISKRERLWQEAKIKHATTDEWMDRLDTGKPSIENGKLSTKISFELFLGYIVGRKHPKTDATQILDRAKINSILPLAENQVEKPFSTHSYANLGTTFAEIAETPTHLEIQ